MLFRLILIVAALCAGAVGYYKFDTHRAKQCENWLATAKALLTDGYYSASIERINLFFSETDCRGEKDPEAVKLMARAKPHVSVKGVDKNGQTLVLARLHGRLADDPAMHLLAAEAALAANDWARAIRAAEKAQGAKAIMIKVTALIQLADWEGLEDYLGNLRASDLNDFERIMIEHMIADVPIKPIAFALDNQALAYSARKIVAGEFDRRVGTYLDKNKNILSEDILSIFSLYLVAAGREDVAVDLLDQPDRHIRATLLKRLATLLWRLGDHEKLSRLKNQRKNQVLPPEIVAMICLAEHIWLGNCSTGFNVLDYQKRFGAYEANGWAAVIAQIQAPRLDPVALLNSMAEIGPLYAENLVFLQLKAQLLYQIGETALSDRYAQQVTLLGGAEYTRSEKGSKLLCEDKDSCLVERKNRGNFSIADWRKLVNEGVELTTSDIEMLKQVSPDQSLFWRMQKAKSLISAGSSEANAEAILLLRPIIQWLPDHAAARLLSASSYAYFGDHQKAYKHLQAAIKAEPSVAIQALRLSLSFGGGGQGLPARLLVRWWTNLTRAELSSRSVDKTSELARSLLVDRYAILAWYAEQNRDNTLAGLVYREILGIAPDNHMALNNLAVLLLKEGKGLDQALILARKAVRLVPEENAYQETLIDVNAAISSENAKKEVDDKRLGKGRATFAL